MVRCFWLSHRHTYMRNGGHTSVDSRRILTDADECSSSQDGKVRHLIFDSNLPNELRVRAQTTLGFALDLMKSASAKMTPGEKGRRDDLGKLTDHHLSVLAGATPERVFRPESSYLQWDALREVVDEIDIPKILSWFERAGLYFATSRPARLAAPLVMRAVRGQILKQVGGFVQIEEDASANNVIESLESDSRFTGIGYEANLVVEAATTGEEAKKNLQWYKDAVTATAQRIAIKPTALVALSTSAIATASSSKHLANALKEIFAEADKYRNENNASYTEICIDSERSDLLDMTREAVLEAAKAFPRVRIKMAMQSYLRDTESQMLDPFLAASAKRVREGGVELGARLVCGANTEGEEWLASKMGLSGTPILPSRPETHANYMRLMRRMIDPLKSGTFTVTHASMNMITVAHHLIELAKAGVFAEAHGGAVSFAMLKGMTGQEMFRELTERYGVECHEYIPVISLDRIVELFKYYLRRIEEISGQSKDGKTANYLGVTCKNGPDSEKWRRTQVENGYLPALRADATNEHTGAYPPSRGIRPNRGLHENSVVSHNIHQYRITPAMNAAALETRQWVDERIQACKDRTDSDAVHIRPSWYGSNLIRNVHHVKGPTRTNLTLAKVEYAQKADIDFAFELAEKDPAGWGKKSMKERLDILSKVEGEFRESREKLVEALMLDAGKSVPEADAEVDEMMDFSRLTDLQWRALLARDHLEFSTDGNGTAVVVCPKNFPQAIPAAHISALLSVGYRVLVKPSGGEGEETMLSTLEMVKCFHRAGVPEQALLFVPCDNKNAAYLTGHAKAERIRFTGSAKTAETIHKCNPGADVQAETGATNVAIIDSSMDLKEAAQMIVASVCGYAGQKCSKLRLVIATKDVNMAELKKHLVNITKEMLVATALTPHVDVTPLRRTPNHDDPLYDRIVKRQPGEQWLLNPATVGAPGIREADPEEFDVAKMEEIFAPIFTIMQVDGGIEEAVATASRSRGSLTAALYSRKQPHIDYALQHWQTGNLYVNNKSTGARADQGFGDGAGPDAHRGAHGAKTGTQEFLLMNAKVRRRTPGMRMRFNPEKLQEDPTGLQKFLDQVEEKSLSHPIVPAVQNAIHAGRHYLFEQDTYYCEKRPAPYQVKGQHDWIESRPVGQVMLRVSANDAVGDILSKIFATIAAGNSLRLSIPPELQQTFALHEKTLGVSFTEAFPQLSVRIEDDSAVTQCISENDSSTGIRCLLYSNRESVPSEVFSAAAEKSLHIDCREVTGDGRVDMITQYRQQSFCNVYHVAGDTSYEDERRKRASRRSKK
ncbi:MAG: aldehyde dehydrogenase family protein [Candidatus Peribacteraceae bacterium]|nr:aldehyde dehydrogenase family protein [Candidatus Peribacteraceae bacterium]